MANSYGDVTTSSTPASVYAGTTGGSAGGPTTVVVKALAANSAAVYIGTDASVAAGTGLQLNAGESISLDCWGPDAVWVVSAAAQHVRYIIVHA